MKQVKKFLYLVGILVVFGLMILVGTAIIQLGMAVVAQYIGVVVPEAVLYQVSGSCGVAMVASVCALYVKKKQYTQCIEKKEPIRLSTLLYCGALAISICQILVYAVTTLLFSQSFPIVESSQISAEKTYVNVIFAIFVAPIFEELLFRMGLYTLLRRKFGEVSSVILCALIFAVMHGYSIQGLFACVAAGLVFTLIYVRTGNIWYSVLAHMVCNLETTILNGLEAKGVVWMGILVQYEINGYNMLHPALIVIAAVFCVVCIIRAKRKKR